MNEGWIVIRKYNTQLEADLDAGILETNGIDAVVQGAPIGIFGPGYSGATSSGVHLLIPGDRAADAEDLLGPVEPE